MERIKRGKSIDIFYYIQKASSKNSALQASLSPSESLLNIEAIRLLLKPKEKKMLKEPSLKGSGESLKSRSLAAEIKSSKPLTRVKRGGTAQKPKSQRLSVKKKEKPVSFLPLIHKNEKTFISKFNNFNNNSTLKTSLKETQIDEKIETIAYDETVLKVNETQSKKDWKIRRKKQETQRLHCEPSFSDIPCRDSKITDTCLYKTIKDCCEDSFLNKAKGCVIRWKAGEVLATGSTSIIYKALDLTTKKTFVVKRILSSTESDMIKSYFNEVEIFKSISHPNIICYLGAEIIESEPCIYMEYVSGGNLRYFIEKYAENNENAIRFYLLQILKGLAYLHAKGIVHRDIKAANILIDNSGAVKLSDFGCSSLLPALLNQSCALNSLKGTLPWMAPEVISQKLYGKKADIWSVGCVVLEMLTGYPPWSDLENFVQAFQLIAESEKTPTIPVGISDELREILDHCFLRNASERPTAEELLKFGFFSKID